MRDTQKQPFGDMPLVVVSAGVKDYPSGLNVPAEELRRLHEQNQADLLGLSRNRERTVAAAARHHVQLDAPEVVVEAIRRVVHSARSGKSL